jgi:hypothetical protein
VALDGAGGELVSVREPWLDTGGPVRDLLLAIFSWVAEQELRRLVERTRAGIERARAKGTKSGKAIGRPRRLIRADVERARTMHAAGRSVRAIAMVLDGVFTRDEQGRALFHPAPRPTGSELDQVVRHMHRRAVAWLNRKGHLGALCARADLPRCLRRHRDGARSGARHSR